MKAGNLAVKGAFYDQPTLLHNAHPCKQLLWQFKQQIPVLWILGSKLLMNSVGINTAPDDEW